jgi:cysteine-S-conjugate beta-lyase
MPVRRHRSATDWPYPDLVLRISIGLEDEAELRDDIGRIFDQS